jgi:dolichyldiphosphatase
MVVLGSFVLARRELELIFGLTGLLVNEALSVLLKHLIRQPRPATAYNHGFGMPSSHTQLMACFTAYIALWLYRTSTRTTTAGGGGGGGAAERIEHVRCDRYGRWAKPLVVALCLSASVAVGLSRVMLGVHTPEQVVAGGLVGALCGCGWHVLGNRLVRRRFGWLEETRCARLLLLRDSSAVPDVLLHEYTLHRRFRTGIPPEAAASPHSD